MIAINDQYHVRGWRGLRGRTINACTRLLRHVEQAVGFFNFIMFPTIFSLGVAELGPLTGNGSGILSMAIVRGAIVALMQGAIAGHIGITMPSSFP